MMGKRPWHSKKFWASLLGALIPACNYFFGWQLSPEEVGTVILPIVGYVVGQGIADAGKSKHEKW